jgi:hypothetical protein
MRLPSRHSDGCWILLPGLKKIGILCGPVPGFHSVKVPQIHFDQALFLNERSRGVEFLYEVCRLSGPKQRA